ncbi:hypothetical protein EPO34_00005, partial [Patescibacteria group bacterium]
AAVHPGATDTCGDGIDQDCSGSDAACAPNNPPSGGAADADGDGISTVLDCNDNDPLIKPGATDTCGDGIDQDCSGSDAACAPNPPPSGGAVDADNDGASTANGFDCNDNNGAIHPGATDTCGDGIDQDCSGSDAACAPNNPPSGGAVDTDNDGYSTVADCNDNDPNVHPQAADVCADGVDANCDGSDACVANPGNPSSPPSASYALEVKPGDASGHKKELCGVPVFHRASHQGAPAYWVPFKGHFPASANIQMGALNESLKVYMRAADGKYCLDLSKFGADVTFEGVLVSSIEQNSDSAPAPVHITDPGGWDYSENYEFCGAGRPICEMDSDNSSYFRERVKYSAATDTAVEDGNGCASGQDYNPFQDLCIG